MDLDKFKSINDTFGHSEGDKALKQLTKILRGAATDGERLFRFAGDEFIILKLSDGVDGLDDFMQRVRKSIAAFNAQRRPYMFSISYGTAFFDGGNADLFLKKLDERMYQMKESHQEYVVILPTDAPSPTK